MGSNLSKPVTYRYFSNVCSVFFSGKFLVVFWCFGTRYILAPGTQFEAGQGVNHLYEPVRFQKHQPKTFSVKLNQVNRSYKMY